MRPLILLLALYFIGLVFNLYQQGDLKTNSSFQTKTHKYADRKRRIDRFLTDRYN